jgi:hypothetical protein
MIAFRRALSSQIPPGVISGVKPMHCEPIHSFTILTSAAATASVTFTFNSNNVANTATWTPTFSPRLAALGRIYEKFRVVGYRYNIEVLCRAATTDGYCTIQNNSVTDYQTSSGNSTDTTTATDPRTQSFLLPAINKYPCYFKKRAYFSMDTVMGNQTWREDAGFVGTFDNSGAVTSSPTIVTYLSIACSPVSAGAWTASESPRFLVHLVQDVIFSDTRV